MWNPSKRSRRGFEAGANDEDALSSRQSHANVFLNRLMGADLEAIPNCDGMRVLRDLPSLEAAPPKVYNMVIRNITEPFWKACIDMVTDDSEGVSYRVCAVGTAGTGKSATVPFLIRLLLERGETVVYHIRALNGQGWIYEFLPQKDDQDIETIVYLECEMARIRSLQLPSTYYIVEPGQTKDSCNPELTIAAKVIIVASLEKDQWGDAEFTAQRHGTVGTFKLFPLWELEEIVAASEFMGCRLVKQTVLDRFRQVGGVPGVIFSGTTNYRWCWTQHKDAANKITKEQIVAIGNNPRRVSSVMRLPQLQSLIVGYTNVDESFENADVGFNSVIVRETFITNHIQSLWSFMTRNDLEPVFLAYTRMLLLSATNIHMSCRIVYRPWVKSPRSREEMLWGCTDIRLVDSITDAVKTQERKVVYYTEKRQYGLIDYMYQDDRGHIHAFHVAILDHAEYKLPTDRIVEFLQEFGNEQSVSLYFVVPGKAMHWLDELELAKDPTPPGSNCKLYLAEVPTPPDVIY